MRDQLKMHLKIFLKFLNRFIKNKSTESFLSTKTMRHRYIHYFFALLIVEVCIFLQRGVLKLETKFSFFPAKEILYKVNGNKEYLWDYKWINKTETLTISNFTYPNNISRSYAPIYFKTIRPFKWPRVSPVYRELRYFFHAQDVFVGKEFLVDKDGTYIYYMDLVKKWNVSNFTYTKRCENMVLCTFPWNGYGHWMHDHLPSLMLVPDYVWETHPVVVLRTWAPKWSLNMIGVLDKIKEIWTYQNEEVYFANNVYFVRTQELAFGFGPNTYQDLRNRFMTFWSSKNTKPVDYCLMNKEPKLHRHITNMNDLQEALEKHTNFKWKFIPNNYTQFKKFVHNLGNTKLMVIPGGAIAFNMFYMHPESAILILLGNFMDYCNFQIAQVLGIFTVAQFHEHDHYKAPGGPTNITLAIHNVDMLMYAQAHGHFPKDPDYCYLYNLTKIRGILDKDPRLELALDVLG